MNPTQYNTTVYSPTVNVIILQYQEQQKIFLIILTIHKDNLNDVFTKREVIQSF